MKLTGKRTLYQEIASRIVTLIRQGVLKPGEKIPSIREMSSRLGVSINTVRESYYQLENDRLIEAVPQSGYYVTGWIPEVSQSSPQQNSIENLNPSRVSLCSIYGVFKERSNYSPGVELGIASIDPELWPSDKLYKYYIDALKTRHDEALDYCISPGLRELREQLSIFSIKHGIKSGAEDYIITSGCSESLYLAMSAILEKGDTIAIESPVYFNLLHLCDELSLNVIEIPTHPETGISIETLEFACEHYDIKAVLVISAFSNPTGAAIPPARMEALVELTAGNDIPLIEDMIYSELYYDGKPPKSCKYYDKKGNVIVCSSFSKILAPGIRAGWIMGGKYHERILRRKTILNIGTAALPQMVIAQFIQEGGVDRYLRNLRKTLEVQLIQMRTKIIETFPEGTAVQMPKGGFLLWIELPENLDSNRLYEELIQKQIIIAPGSLFSMTGKYLNCIRLNGGIWNSHIEQSVAAVGKHACTLQNIYAGTPRKQPGISGAKTQQL